MKFLEWNFPSEPAILSHRPRRNPEESPLPASGPRYNKIAMIAKDLLDMLVCPVCKTPVVLHDNGMSLKCGQCHRAYPIKDDIPVMLVDAAKIEAP